MSLSLVTGANRGVGLALVRGLAAKGGTVIAAARSGAPEGAGIEPMRLDVRSESDLAALSAALEGRGLDLLVCNAGVAKGRGAIDDPTIDMASFDETFAVNVTGVFFTVRACLPALRRAKGRVAVISSQMGSSARAKAGSFSYRASKAAATNLAVTMARALAPEGIAIGAYHPGWVRTDMGGSTADISVEESAAGLIARFEELGVETAGCFRFYSGEDIPF